MISRYGSVYLLPAILALTGPVVLAVATQGAFLPIACAWWAVSLGVVSVTSRKARMGICLLLMPACVLLAFEGGLFMLPAVVSMFVIDLATAPTRRLTTTRHAGR